MLSAHDEKLASWGKNYQTRQIFVSRPREAKFSPKFCRTHAETAELKLSHEAKSSAVYLKCAPALRARDRTRPPWCWRCGGKYFIGLPVATIPSPFSNWVRKWRQDIKSLFSKFKSRIRRQIQSKIILMGHSWVILGHSSSFWIIPAHSRSFQVIPRFSNYPISKNTRSKNLIICDDLN